MKNTMKSHIREMAKTPSKRKEIFKFMEEIANDPHTTSRPFAIQIGINHDGGEKERPHIWRAQHDHKISKLEQEMLSENINDLSVLSAVLLKPEVIFDDSTEEELKSHNHKEICKIIDALKKKRGVSEKDLISELYHPVYSSFTKGLHQNPLLTDEFPEKMVEGLEKADKNKYKKHLIEAFGNPLSSMDWGNEIQMIRD